LVIGSQRAGDECFDVINRACDGTAVEVDGEGGLGAGVVRDAILAFAEAVGLCFMQAVEMLRAACGLDQQPWHASEEIFKDPALIGVHITQEIQQ
jgi:hypothetical protein